MKDKLFTESSIGSLTLKNRWIMSAMTTGFSKEGHLSERDFDFYEARAKGGAAAVIIPVKTENSAGSRQMYTLESDEFCSEYKKLSEKIQESGCKAVYQLFHCASCVSDFSVEELNRKKENFILAAGRAKKCGADAIEISCGDGYFLSQFLSPLTNQRIDEYGGEEESRIRFPLEILREIRKEVGTSFPILVRVSGAQLIAGGYDIEFTRRFCMRLEEEGIADALEITPGWEQKEIPVTFYQVPEGGYAFFADAVKRAVSIPVLAATGVIKPETAEKMMEKGICDFIATARGFLADAEMVNKIEKKSSYNICQRCNICFAYLEQNGEAVCAYNPEAGKEYLEKQHRKVATAKKVLVIGGGPAGMMAAKKAAERGYKTTLCLKEDRLGGSLNLAAKAPGKEGLLSFISNLQKELEELGVEIRYKTEVDGNYAAAFQPYFVVVATGSIPAGLDIPGISLDHVIQANDVFAGDGELWKTLKKGKTVIVGGGSAGLEAAAFLADQSMVSEESFSFIRRYKPEAFYKLYHPLDITILEKTDRTGSDLGNADWIMQQELKEYGIQCMTHVTVKEIRKGAVLAEINHGMVKIKADHVILALGETPAPTDLTKKLEDERISFAKIGDADQIGGAFYALHSAFDLFLRVFIV